MIADNSHSSTTLSLELVSDGQELTRAKTGFLQYLVMRHQGMLCFHHEALIFVVYLRFPLSPAAHSQVHVPALSVFMT